MILPEFGNLALKAIEAHDVAKWEKELVAKGYKPRTAREARKLLSTILSDAIPRYIQVNPAARKRGKGKKGQRRIAEAEKAEKVWPTPLQALLFAERCAVLSGDDSDFVLNITTFYTAMRWSEVMGLGPKFVGKALFDVQWKLYELNGRFSRGRPKDASIRPADSPPFLAMLLEWQIDTHPNRKCSCGNDEAPWCPGMEYVFRRPGTRITAARITRQGSCGPPLTPGTRNGKAATATRLCRCSWTLTPPGPGCRSPLRRGGAGRAGPAPRHHPDPLGRGPDAAPRPARARRALPGAHPRTRRP